MAKSVGVIIARVLVALIILAGIGACIYFFVIKNDNVRGAVYEELSKTLASENQNTLQTNIGTEIEKGTYYTFNKDVNDCGYDKIYLAYYIDQQILNTYSALLVYVGNIDNKRVNEIQDNITNYNNALTQALRSQTLFNDTYSQLGADEVTAENFKSMVQDFKSLQQVFHTLTTNTFNYVVEHFYKDINAKLSQKYVLTYGLSIQSNLMNVALNSETGVNANLYLDSKEMVNHFVDCKSNNFTSQSTDLDVAEFISLFSNAQKDFSGFLNSTDKAAYYNEASSDGKQDLYIIIRGFGLTGRV